MPKSPARKRADREYRARIVETRRSEGLCAVCGKEPIAFDRSEWEGWNCIKARRARYKKLRTKRRKPMTKP